jgi:hypothetical protein
MADASLNGGDVMEKMTVTLVRMKRIARRNEHAHVEWMNFHVPLATAYRYATLLTHTCVMFQYYFYFGFG